MLEGGCTALRAIEREDLPQLLAWRNQPAFRRFFREYRELGSDNQKAWFEARVLSDPSTRMFSIVDKATGELLGASGLCYIDWINRNADFSIYIGWQNVYIDECFAPDAARTMMKYAFEELNLHRLWTELYDFDEKKIAMFSSLGFREEGRHRQTHFTEGKWCDSVFYAILSDGIQK